MKKRSMRAVMIYMILVMTLALFGAQNVFAKDDEAVIDKVRLTFNAAYNSGDAKAMAALIDAEAVWMPPTGEPAIVGAQKIAARYTAFFAKTRSAFELQPGKIQICGQWAFLNGPWQRQDSAKQGGAVMKHGGYYLIVFKKQSDGSWKIARDIWNDTPKP